MTSTTNPTKATRKPRWALEPQIRMVAGSIVLFAVVASIWWPPARYLAGAIGLGLTLAAVTDTCLLGKDADEAALQPDQTRLNDRPTRSVSWNCSA